MIKKLLIALPINKPRSNYDGAELKAYTGRTGAMDAFSKPSRINDELQDYKPPMLIGTNIVPCGFEK